MALIGGCSTKSTWKQRPLATNGALVISPEGPIRVTRRDGSVIVLQRPRVVGDSLTGDVGLPPERMALLLRDVQRIDERSQGVDKAGTAANVAKGSAVLLGLVAFGGLLLLLSVYDQDSR
jgi:hypothetical protein